MRIIPALLFFLFLPSYAQAAVTLSFSPEQGSFVIGDTFTVDVLLDTGDVTISSAEAEISFNSAVLAVERITTEASILSTWPTTPIFSNEAANIRFTGWTKSNFLGSRGTLLTITFRALQNGIGDVRFVTGAALAAYERGSNTVSAMRSAAYTVAPRSLSVATSTTEETETRIPAVLGVASELPPPRFTEYKGAIRVGESIRVRGETAPDTPVTIRLARADVGEEQSVVTSFSDGTFSFASAPVTESGVYRLSATVVDAYGIESESTEKIIITVLPRGFAAAILAGPSLWLFLPLLFIAAVFFVLYARLHRSIGRTEPAHKGEMV